MLQAADLPARYELRDRLGAGGMGEVWRAFDRERGGEVALKVLTGGDAEARFLFKQEFWALAELKHPNLVAGHDYGETVDGLPWFTMELVEGQEPGTLDEAAVRALLPGLLAGLAYLHGRGWLHGDLKPENVRVTPDGSAKLIDLGLLQRLGKPAGAIRGTLAYVAPEAVRQGALDARSDLYALGGVLFHVLAGRPPFQHQDALALLRAHLDERPPALRELVPAVSAELDAAVRRLLAKDPADRYGSAAELAAALGLEAALDEGAALLAAPLVGRDAVFEALRAMESGVHVVAGPPGSGRTRLLDALRAEAQLAGVPTLAARGEGADAPPYQALRPWLRAIAAHRGPSFDHLAPLVARLAPEVGVPPAPALDGAQERLRAHDALAALAAEAVPANAAWLLDDADRLDAPSTELVATLRRAGAGWRWLLAGGPELAAGPGEALHGLPALSDAEVRALAGHLLGVAPAALPAEVAEGLPALADGRPGAAEAALAHWVRTGALVRRAGRWEVAPGVEFDAPGDLAEALAARVAALGPAPAAIAAAAARLGAPADLAWLAAVVDLDDRAFFAGLAALRAAGVLAVEGDRFRFERAAVGEVLAAGRAPEFHARAFQTLVPPPWGGDSREAAGAGDRERVARSAPHPGPTGLSRPGGAGDLTWLLAKARHGLASTTPAQGVPHAIAAARAAFAIHAVSTAEPLLTAALAVPGLEAGQEADLLGLLGYARRFAGDVDGALALYDDRLLPLLREAPGPALVEHLVTRGVLLQLKGRYDDALAAHAEAINLADAQGAAFQAIRARLFAGRVGVFAGQAKVARTALRAAVKRARALAAEGGPDLDAVRSLLGRALSFLGYVTATGDPGAAAEGLAMLDEAVALNRAIGDLRETHEALNNQGNVYMALGRYPAARDVFAECLALCGRMGSPNEAVIAHLNLGGALLELGMPLEAAGHARTAADAARAQGRQFPEGYARALLGAALVRRGAPAEGLAELEAGLGLARAIGNRYLELNVLAYRAQALLDAGAWPEATTAIAQARSLAASSGNEEFEPRLARAELARLVLEGAPGAADALAAAIGRARAGAREADLAHALRWLASHHAAAGTGHEAGRAALEALGAATALGLVRVQAELHLVLATIVAGGGHPDRAAEHLARAQGLAAASGDALGEAVAAAALAQAAGDARAARQAGDRLEAMLAGLDDAARAAFLRFPERRAALAAPATGGGLAPARVRHLTALVAAIADAHDLPALMDQALAALIDLADAERGFLVLYDDFEERERLVLTAPGVDPLEAGDAYSSSVAEQVLWTGEPLFVEDAGAHAGLAGQASVQALALRRVVGLPLRAGGQTIGVMIADSRRLGAGFGEAERELAGALAQAVALAVGHARRHAEADAELQALRAVQALARATAGLTDFAAFGQAALAAGLAACEAERAFLLLEGGDGTRVAAARGPEGPLPAEAPDLSGSVCRWVLEHGEPLHMVDVQAEEAFQAARSVMALGLRTIWALPLRTDGGVAGLLYLDSRKLGEGPAAAMRTLGAIADLAAAFVARGREPGDRV